MTVMRPLTGLIGLLLCSWALAFPAVALERHQDLAHAKGLYKTKAEAERRAKELGCQGTHQNNGLWMPCGHEAALHNELRED